MRNLWKQRNCFLARRTQSTQRASSSADVSRPRVRSIRRPLRPALDDLCVFLGHDDREVVQLLGWLSGSLMPMSPPRSTEARPTWLLESSIAGEATLQRRRLVSKSAVLLTRWSVFLCALRVLCSERSVAVPKSHASRNNGDFELFLRTEDAELRRERRGAASSWQRLESGHCEVLVQRKDLANAPCLHHLEAHRIRDTQPLIAIAT